MSNTIPRRIFDFLKDFPPFNQIEKIDLLALSSKIVVQYYEAEQSIFLQGQEPSAFIYVVKDGAVQLFRGPVDEDLLVDYCDEGDVFGLRPLLAEENYGLTAVAKEETLIYAVPIAPLKLILENTPRASWFLAQSFAAGVRNIEADKRQKGRLFINKQPFAAPFVSNPLSELQQIEPIRSPVTCRPSMSIKSAAAIMNLENVGSIIVVDERNFPIGIVTDKDMRAMVGEGTWKTSDAVKNIMSSPVITATTGLTITDALILFLKKRIRHLVLTEDGTDQTPVKGVVSHRDMLVLQGNNPGSFIRQIQRSTTPFQLRKIRERAEKLLSNYIYQEVSIAYILTVMTEVNDALTRKVIELAINSHPKNPPDAGFCFISLGSQGRSEQLLRTDQDNAIVFEDVEPEAYEETKAYYLELGAKINQLLYDCGFDYCPAEMMARNPNWCLSLSEWKEQFSNWIFHPKAENLLYSFIFFDYRPIYGILSLAEELTKQIFHDLDQQTIFLAYAAKAAVENPPPLSFFRNFVVERSGDHKDEFDIKKRAMMPLADAARVLILQARIPNINNTFQRFDKLAELEPQNREVFEQAADAYEILVRYRTLNGLRNKNTGRYLNPSELSKMERLNLRNSFRPIRDLQSLLTVRFQLGFLR